MRSLSGAAARHWGVLLIAVAGFVTVAAATFLWLAVAFPLWGTTTIVIVRE